MQSKGKWGGTRSNVLSKGGRWVSLQGRISSEINKEYQQNLLNFMINSLSFGKDKILSRA